MDPRSPIPRGGFVALIPLTAGMCAEADTLLGPCPHSTAAAYFADQIIESLVIAQAEADFPTDVLVLGYRSDGNGGTEFISLLPGSDWMQVAELAGTEAPPRSEGHPRRWTREEIGDGEVSASAALAEVQFRLGRWLAARGSIRAAVVLHYTLGEGIDAEYHRAARSLTSLIAGAGHVRLVHLNLAEGAKSIEPLEFAAGWPLAEIWDMLFASEAESSPFIAAETTPFVNVRSFFCPKLGNTAEEWEDAFAIETATVAVADGASEGIFCRVWASLLARKCAAGPPDAFAPWLAAARADWRNEVNFPSLRWSQQAKVTDVGAAATLLALTLGLASESGERPWQALALGDACLFWIRDGSLHASFPLASSEHLKAPPLLVRTKAGPLHHPLRASGTCRAGDRFVLATDAVAGMLFRDADIDWSRFDALSESDWQAETDAARRDGTMVNDDCTLVVLRVD